MSETYVTGLLDELAMHKAAGRSERAREVLAELQRVAPDVAKQLAPKTERAVVDKAPKETR